MDPTALIAALQDFSALSVARGLGKLSGQRERMETSNDNEGSWERRRSPKKLREVSTLSSLLKYPKSLYKERKQDMIDIQKTIAEQELIALLSRLCPIAIHITPHTREDGITVYAWQAWDSSGTHPALLGAVQAALEAAMVSLAYAPVSPEARLTQADFPPRLGYIWPRAT